MDSKHPCRGLENSWLTGQEEAGGKGAEAPKFALFPHRFWWIWVVSSLAAEELCPVRGSKGSPNTCCPSLDLVSTSAKRKVDLHGGCDGL